MISKLTCLGVCSQTSLFFSLLVGQHSDLTIFEPKCTGLTIFAIFGDVENPLLGFGKRPGLADKFSRSGQAMAEVWEAIGGITVTN